jgi:ATP-dependent protease ClpP protease subunit
MNNWYSIKNEAKEVDVYIYDEIGSYDISAKSFIEEIKDHKNKTLNIHINSLGGEVFDGMAIASAIKSHKGTTRTYIEGIAASISTVIALSADEIYMSENSLFMIHNAWGGSMGDAGDLRKQADLLDKISNEIARIYISKTNLSKDEILDMMKEETWLDAEEAKEMGFIDGITEAVKVAAKYDVSNFKNITEDKIKSIINNKNQKDMAKSEKTLLEEIKALFVKSEVEDTVKAEVQNEEGDVEGTDEELMPDWYKETYEELKSRVDKLEKKVDALSGEAEESKEEYAKVEKELTDTKGELETANESVVALGKELSKINATGTTLEVETDPNPVKEDKKVDSNTASFNALAELLRTK